MIMDQYIGRLLDNRYEILEVIGTGGMAVVYKARCHRLNRLVAIKILKDEFARDEEFRRRFRAEGEAVAMLSHPNIVQVYDVSSTEIANYIVMELIDGISLKQYMEKKGVLNWKETLHFAMLIAKGLEHAHSRGIVHRDIKPHNVMVLKNGSVKVMDFGIARIMSKTNTLTKEALGSVHYISPEQAKGGWVDNRSDLYSLSVVMYEMMTGRPPYDGESPVAVAIQHINGGAAMPSTLNPNIPGGLEQIIMKGMALETKDRYSSATEMLRDMEEFRKNPAILFAFGMPAGVTDATQPIQLGSLRQQTGPVSTAERVARRSGESAGSRPANKPRTGTASGRVPSGTGNVPGRSAARRTSEPVRRDTGRTGAQRRRSRQEVEAEEKRSRMTAITIVACSIVAVIGIGIFLVALMSGAFFNQETELVEVPDLIGDIYYSGMTIDGFVIDAEHTYNDEYDRGQIFDHTPEQGNKVQRGTELKVWVSLGPEPMVKVMEDLIGQSAEDAESFLKAQGVNPLVREGDFSDDIEEGKVIRTEPAAGTTLTEGQTVYIYVSKGPMIKTGRMPNVVGLNYATAYRQLVDLGFTNVEPKYVENDADKDEVVDQSVKRDTVLDLTTRIVLSVSKGSTVKTARMPNVVGLNYATAYRQLTNLGFTNVEPKYVENDADKDEVVDQSVKRDTLLDLTTPIVLSVSKGPAETEPSTEEPTEEPTEATTEPQEKTRVVTITLPERSEAYILDLLQNGNQVRESQQIMPGTESVSVELTGVGLQRYAVYINNELYRYIEVDFT